MIVNKQCDRIAWFLGGIRQYCDGLLSYQIIAEHDHLWGGWFDLMFTFPSQDGEIERGKWGL